MASTCRSNRSKSWPKACRSPAWERVTRSISSVLSVVIVLVLMVRVVMIFLAFLRRLLGGQGDKLAASRYGRQSNKLAACCYGQTRRGQEAAAAAARVTAGRVDPPASAGDRWVGLGTA